MEKAKTIDHPQRTPKKKRQGKQCTFAELNQECTSKLAALMKGYLEATKENQRLKKTLQLLYKKHTDETNELKSKISALERLLIEKNERNKTLDMIVNYQLSHSSPPLTSSALSKNEQNNQDSNIQKSPSVKCIQNETKDNSKVTDNEPQPQIKTEKENHVKVIDVIPLKEKKKLTTKKTSLSLLLLLLLN